MTSAPARLDRARGCLLGQLAGDALGSLVEFQSPQRIAARYPDGVRDLADGGAWNTLAGQPTDDSELALALARRLVHDGTYDAGRVQAAYRAWRDSGPFDIGGTTELGLSGHPDPASQSNGALMRVSPLGIFGVGRDPSLVATWARTDAGLTHVHPVCADVNVLFTLAIAWGVGFGPPPADLHARVAAWADRMPAADAVREAVAASREGPPADCVRHMGWVLIAFRNALAQLLHADTLEEGVIDTVSRGGDTDTNAAICGALLGAVHGRGAVPRRWERTLLACRPAHDNPRAARPRPREYWPGDALVLAERLLERPGVSPRDP